MKPPLKLFDIFLIALAITGVLISAFDVHYMFGFMTVTVIAVLNAAFPSQHQRFRKSRDAIGRETSELRAENQVPQG